jgi:hypothetical protein
MPSPRTQPMMAYDPDLGKVVLFGGYDPASLRGLPDTWVFLNGTWTDISSKLITHPPARWGAAYTYDPLLHGILLFGGRTESKFFNDTWYFDNHGWHLVTPTTAPSPRNGVTMAYSPLSQQVVLFGGGRLHFYPGNWTYFNDTWTFWNGTWHRAGHAPVAPQWGAHLVFDTVHSSLLLFGVSSGGSSANQVWSYVNGSWSQVSTRHAPPAYVFTAGTVAWDAKSSLVLFVGGQNGPTPTKDTWTYRNGVFTNLTSSLSPAPSARGLGGLTYDTADGYTLLFGGSTVPPNYTYQNDSWTFV